MFWFSQEVNRGPRDNMARLMAEMMKKVFSTDRGLGDTVARATKALGVQPCENCRQRQARLNNLVRYPDRPGFEGSKMED